MCGEHGKLVAIRQKENTHGRIGCICAGAREEKRFYHISTDEVYGSLGFDDCKFKEEDKEIIYIEYKCECPDNINDSCINENALGG